MQNHTADQWGQDSHGGSLSILGEMGNLMPQGLQGTQVLGLKLLWETLRPRFWMTLRFEPADEGDGPPHVSRPHVTCWKPWQNQQVCKGGFATQPLGAGHCILCLGAQLTYTSSTAGSPAC